MNRQFVLRAAAASLLAIAPSSVIYAAGPNPEAEGTIRAIIASMDNPANQPDRPGGQRPGFLSDAVFWSAAYLRPVVLPEKGQPHPGKYSIPNRVPGSQKTRTEVIRIVVADSGELAYEYSKGNLQFDLKAGEHIRACSHY